MVLSRKVNSNLLNPLFFLSLRCISSIYRSSLENATCVVFWGADPLVTNDVDWACPLHEGQAALSALRSLGTKSIFINPIRGETAKYLNSRWISVFPGSDCALMLALMHVLLTRDLVDLNLCHRLAYGVDTFIDYVLGHNDGQPKTPLWAEGITHLPQRGQRSLPSSRFLSFIFRCRF